MEIALSDWYRGKTDRKKTNDLLTGLRLDKNAAELLATVRSLDELHGQIEKWQAGTLTDEDFRQFIRQSGIAEPEDV